MHSYDVISNAPERQELQASSTVSTRAVLRGTKLLELGSFALRLVQYIHFLVSFDTLLLVVRRF